MTGDTDIASVGAAFLLGATSSLHCLAMCGPLAGSIVAAPAGKRLSAALAYHASRIAAYTFAGLLLGLTGSSTARALSLSVAPVLPWVLAAVLLLAAFDIWQRIPPIPGLSRLTTPVMRFAFRLSHTFRAAVVGAITPLLPCGLLYSVFLIALSTQSALSGAAILAAFAIASAPALAVAQVQTRFSSRFPRATAFAFRRALPLVAAAVLVYRAVLDSPGGAPSCH